MRSTSSIGVAVVGAAIMFFSSFTLQAAPPETLSIGGTIQQADDGTSSGGAVWCVYDTAPSDDHADIAAGDTLFGLWFDDMGLESSGVGVGTNCMAVVSRILGTGTITHTGYYAVVNHILTGDDPAIFPEMTLRQIPVPVVTASNLAELSWTQAIEDAGEGDVTNIIGYVIYRGTDGIVFDAVGTTSETNYTDAIPNDAEYYYSIGLLYRGTPVVTSLAMSANSACIFKDSDMDTLPDYYELANGLDELSGSGTNGPAGDADSDSMSNYEEWIAGTMANSATSYFFAKEITGDGSGMSIEWEGVAQRSYELQRSDQLGSGVWTNIYGPILCTNNQAMQYIDTSASNGVSFYNLIVSKP